MTVKRRRPGIFCIEGEWGNSLHDERSVRPLLDVVHRQEDVDFLHRRVSTIEEFEALVARWQQRQYSRYKVGYFAFHGSPGVIWIGRKRIDLERLGELMAGKAHGKTLYFGSCKTVQVPNSRLDEFKRITGARVVAGFTRNVDWLESAAFDLLALNAFTKFARIDGARNSLERSYPDLVRLNRFVMR